MTKKKEKTAETLTMKDVVTATLREAAARAASERLDRGVPLILDALVDMYLAGYEAAKAESAIAAEPPCCGNCAKRHSEICVDTVNDYDDPCDEYERRPQ